MKKKNAKTKLEKLSIQTGRDLTLIYNQSDATLSTELIGTFIETASKEGELNPLCFVSLPGYCWDGKMKQTKIELETTFMNPIYFWILRMLLNVE